MAAERQSNVVGYSVRVAVLAMCLAFPSLAWGLAGAHPNDQPVGGTDAWPRGLKELVNSHERVHGFFVNWEDVFYFAGDTDKLNAFMKSYAQMTPARLHVVLHAGTPDLQVKSHSDKDPREVKADWKLYCAPFTHEEAIEREKAHESAPPLPFLVRLEIWSGGQIDVNKLEMPATLSLEAADDARKDLPIQKLVLRHKKIHSEAIAEQIRSAEADEQGSKWIANALQEIQSLKPGMSRAELLKVLREEGGLSTRTQRRYAYRGCPYIKVNVKFEAVGEPDGGAGAGAASSQDKVTSVSQPFLEWTIGD